MNEEENLNLPSNDEQNTSAEDLLGKETLLLSDSEAEEDDVQQQQQQLIEKECGHDNAINDEKNFKIGIGENKNECKPLKESIFTENHEINVEKITDNIIMETTDNLAEKLDEIDIAAENENIKSPPVVSTMENNQSDEDDNWHLKDLKKKRAKMFAIIDSDDDEDDDAAGISNNSKPHQMMEENQPEIPKDKKKISTLIDSESETESIDSNVNDVDDDGIKEKLDGRTEEIHMDVDDDDDDGQKMNNIKKSKIKNKPQRASAKKAIDEMQAIQSEQQRLHREAYINIPYHKPKKYTLKEFLKRHTIIKPQMDETTPKNSPTAIVAKIKNLKMTAEELEEYAKLMEERAKEATEFFKSESEDDEPELKDNDGVMDIQSEKIPTPTKSPTTELCENVPTIVAQSTSPMLHTKASSDTTEARIPSSTDFGIVTEVIELPRIDLSAYLSKDPVDVATDTNTLPPCSSTSSAPPPPPPSTSSSSASLTSTALVNNLINENQVIKQPKLQGERNMLIDLETGDFVIKKPAGVDNLLKRLMATKRTPKAKTNETVNILSTENGKIEITKHSIQINEEEKPDLTKEPKPGAAYFKLKENLKNLMARKRLEEFKKKQKQESKDNENYKKKDGFESDAEIDDDDEDEEEYEKTYAQNENGAMEIKKNTKMDKIYVDDEENAIIVDDDDDDEDDADENIDIKPLDDKEAMAMNVEKVKKMDIDTDSDMDLERASDKMTNDNEILDSEQSESGDENENKNEKSGKRKSRLIKAFLNDSDADDDDIDLLKTQTQKFPLSLPADGSCLPMDLFEQESQMDVEKIENELLDLCSGNFDGITPRSMPLSSVRNTQEGGRPLISQIPMTQTPRNSDAERELLALCSGTFENENAGTQSSKAMTLSQLQISQIQFDDDDESQMQKIAPKDFKKMLASSDEDNDDDDMVEMADEKRVKKLTKKMKKEQKKKPKLGFSSDEDEEEENEAQQNKQGHKEYEMDEELSSAEEEEPLPDDELQTFIDYDSEENEIVVQMTKKDCWKKAQTYFEKEAELSGSEWGSADEDDAADNNLDEYDGDLADEEEFDQEKMREEIGKIHARKILDEDIRAVRKLQEIFLDDEENDGIGRQRQFKWKNAENGFNLDESKRPIGNDDDDDVDSGDEENELLWRKIRYEREQLLREEQEQRQLEKEVYKNMMNNLEIAALPKTFHASTSINSTPIGIATNTTTTKLVVNRLNTQISKPIFTTPTPITPPPATAAAAAAGPLKKFSIIAEKLNACPSSSTSTNSPFTSVTSANKKSSPFLITNASAALHKKTVRSSFLVRDKETLTKIAGVKKTNNYEDDLDVGVLAASVTACKPQNFVFTTLSTEEHEEKLKRKADELLNSSSEKGINYMKKPKIETRTGRCLIDQLL